jgi:hypothetical protein
MGVAAWQCKDLFAGAGQSLSEHRIKWREEADSAITRGEQSVLL